MNNRITGVKVARRGKKDAYSCTNGEVSHASSMLLFKQLEGKWKEIADGTRINAA